jgi:DNA-binding NarL/FixJ family response regulator
MRAAAERLSNIRVLIGDAPTMLRDILEQAIANEPDMELIHEPAAPAPGRAEQAPDVVIAGVSECDPGEGARTLLGRWPGSHVLMITARGQKVLRYELQPRSLDLGEMSPDQLVQAIRSAARPERKPYAH